MSLDEYWDGEPYLVQTYTKAFDYKKMIRNQELWLQGLYFYQGLSEALQGFAVGLNGGKGARPKGYLKEPIPITEAEKEMERQRKIKHTLEWVAKGQK